MVGSLSTDFEIGPEMVTVLVWRDVPIGIFC